MANGNNELFQALQYLGQAGKEYGLSLAINQANEQAKQIKSSLIDDMERRTQLSNLADDIAARMAGAGAQGQHIAAVAQSIKPVQASSAEQALMLGMQTGDQSLAAMGKEVMDMEQQRKLAFLKEQADIQFARDKALAGYAADRQDKSLAMQESMAEKKAQRAKYAALPRAEADKVTALDMTAEQLQGLISRMEAEPSKYNSMVGPIDGRFPSILQGGETSAFQADLGRFAASYISSVSGAGVTDSERKILMSNIPNKNDHPGVVLEKSKKMLQNLSRMRNRHITNFKAIGYNVGDLERVAPAGFTPDAGQPSTDPNSPALQVRSFFKPNK